MFGIFESIGPKAAELESYIPAIPGSSIIFQAIFSSEGAEFDLLVTAFAELLDQTFASRVTWAVETWEQELGIITDPGFTIEQRRSVILSKLGSALTATNKRVKHVAYEDLGVNVDVVENSPEYNVIVRATGWAEITPYSAAFEDAMRALIPAHLGITFEYQYGTFDELDAHSWDFDEVDALGHDWDHFEGVI